MLSPPLWQRLSPRRRLPAILCFHDVVDRRWLHGLLRQLSERAEIVSLASLVEHREALDGQVALTFDDGYKSIRTIVEPVCSDLGLPFTTFVCSEVLTGGPAPWYDRVNLVVRTIGSERAARYWGFQSDPGRQLVLALKEAPRDVILRGLAQAESEAGIDSRVLCERFMTEEDLMQVARNPLATIGSHTHTHPILSNLNAEEQRGEIRLSVDTIRRLCNAPVRTFAYPNGKPEDMDSGVVQALREAGVQVAVTTVQRPVLAQDDTMSLPRLGISEGDSIGKLETKWTLPWLSAGDMRENSCRRRYRGYWRTH
jgi:peptidoglycan/xylan/chitin deacetylase (PgdA/CDA1 family)